MAIGAKVCSHCNLQRTKEGYDGCIGFLKRVKNACCGHGDIRGAYVQFDHKNYKEKPNAFRISGQKALDYIQKNGNKAN